VLGFPYIFRGAWMCVPLNQRSYEDGGRPRPRRIGPEDVPDAVLRAYGGQPSASAGIHHPKPFDSRVLLKVVPAVAQAAIDSGVARVRLPERTAYVHQLESSWGRSGKS